MLCTANVQSCFMRVKTQSTRLIHKRGHGTARVVVSTGTFITTLVVQNPFCRFKDGNVLVKVAHSGWTSVGILHKKVMMTDRK